MDFIMRLLVKDYDNSEDTKIRTKCGKAAGAVGIATNILLFAIKLAAGLISNSLAMIADAVNNLTDSASSIVTLAGFKIAEKPADDKHPFGHARMEYISGVIISFIMLFLGFQFGISSVEKIVTPEETVYTPLVIGILIVSILLKIWQSLFYRTVGRKIESETLTATSKDSRNDVVATLVILLGAVITVLTGVNLDGFMGLAVAVFIVVSGIQLVFDTANPLLGTAPDAELVRMIHERILSYDGIIGIHDLTVHNYGVGKCFATVHCEVAAEEDILVSHDIIDNIERDFAEEHSIELVIHLDPVVTSDERTNALCTELKQAVRHIYPEFSIHDFRVVWGITHSNVVFDVAVPFSEKDSDDKIRKVITQLVVQKDSRYRVVLTIDRTSEVNIRYNG